MSTVSRELDRLAAEVLTVLAETRPPRNYAAASQTIYVRWALQVKPDNLRAWHVRRVAVDLSDRTPTDLHSDLDDFAEAIRLWREEGRKWRTISKLLADGFDFKASEQRLRGWWHRRLKRADAIAVASAAVGRGVALMARSSPASAQAQPVPHVPAPASAVVFQSPVATQTPPAASAIPAGRALSGENDAQRRIRERRAQQAAGTGRQDALLDRLAATGSAAPEVTP